MQGGEGGVTALKVHFLKQGFNFFFWNACVFASSLIYSSWEGGLFAILSINCTFQGVSVECHHCSLSQAGKGAPSWAGFLFSAVFVDTTIFLLEPYLTSFSCQIPLYTFNWIFFMQIKG